MIKPIFPIYFILFFIVTNILAQDSEFNPTKNGLVYDDLVYNKLHKIVDSHHIKFKVCDPNKRYFSTQQGKGHYITASGEKAKLILIGIEKGKSFEEIVIEQDSLDVEKDLFIVKSYGQSDEKRYVSIFSPDFDDNKFKIDFDTNLTLYDSPLIGKWIWKFTPPYNQNYTCHLEAIYVTEEITSTVLNAFYSNVLQYSECLIDTTQDLFFEDAKSSGGWFDEYKENDSVTAFIKYVDVITNYPYEDREKLGKWDIEKWNILNQVCSQSSYFKNYLIATTKCAVKNGGSTNELEEYIAKYYSLDSALYLKRKRIVYGGCSMDRAPRYHAMQIATLSAEAANWDVFLRAHLDIMNDNFERMSDNSLASRGRKTYIKELEILNIDVQKLFLGITLRIHNPSKYHYYSSVGRLGKAITESIHKVEFENMILKAIRDTSLDNYNRMIMFNLYVSYINCLQLKKNKSKFVMLKSARLLPEVLKQRAFDFINNEFE